MYKNHCDEIKAGDNVIIGLGDSFTQGVGAYSTETWASIPSNPAVYNISGQHFLEEQAKNNWVRQLCTYNLPDYKVWNLGMNGGGNRSTVRELYLNPLPQNLGNVIVVLMATGIERYDFLKQSDATAGVNWHQKWQTVFPSYNPGRGPIADLDKAYLEHIWSPRTDALEFLFTVSEAQNFCKAHNYKFLFAGAFDDHVNREMILRDLDDKKEYIDIINWNNCINIPNRKTFMDMINQLEGHKYESMHEIHMRQAKMTMPSKYITPCAHWSVEGNRVVANYLFEEFKKRNLL